MIYLFFLISFIFSWAYFGLIYYYLKGWLKKPHHYIRKNQIGLPKSTIILPVRNEEDSIIPCVQSILNQQYAENLYELIIVNDFSTDNTLSLIEENFRSIKEVRIFDLKDHLPSENALIPNKKKAIALAIKESKYDTILTIDGDCTYPSLWLISMLKSFLKSGKKLITGPIDYREKETFLQKFLLMDLASMIGITGGAIGNNKPVMANGANMLYEKATFLELEGYFGNEHIASGDDIFLIQKLQDKYPGSVGFAKLRSAMAVTATPKTFTDFINQRIRWTSKSSKMTDIRVKVVLILNYLFYLLLFLNLFVLPFFNILLG